LTGLLESRGGLNVRSILPGQGLGAFLFFYLLTSLAIIAKMGGDVSSYQPTKWYGFLFADATNHALSFTLFWTLLYTLVYIY
jgi:hypothetical protein